MTDTSLKTLAAAWLKAGGFDGLFESTGICACRIGDLMPCGEPSPDCIAGVEAKCDGPNEICDGECGFHIVRRESK